MSLDPDMIRQAIAQALPGSRVSVEDMRGDGQHYIVHVVSPAFIAKDRVTQQRMVYDALRPYMDDSIDSLAIQTFPPDQVQG
jgi:acid stress-induced BolA-like protein IbaG/YrbA